jgi:hypothetical protein
MVKDFLGHVDLKSTEMYVQADLEMKRNALESELSVSERNFSINSSSPSKASQMIREPSAS